jgi:hypothetical protein
MKIVSRQVSLSRMLLLGGWIAAAIGCGSSDATGGASATVGSAGGTVSLPGGPTIQIPAGALSANTTVTIQGAGQAPSGAPIYQFGPSGTSFAQAVAIEMPVPAGTTAPAIYWTQPGSTTAYDALPTTVSGGTATAQVTHFSLGFVGTSQPAATPTFSPAAGSYTTAQSVTIASATPGAVVHYTTDGSSPTASSPTYAAAVPVTATTTLKAIAVVTGYAASAVGTATYTITAPPPVAATPAFSPAAGSYATAQSVTIASTTAGAVIHYTTDGSTPTSASTAYAGPVAVSATTTLKAIATATGYTDSAVATAVYTITGTLPVAATPTFSPAAGSYTTAQSVTIASTTAGAVIHYTTDGSTPTAASTAYAGPVAVSATTTLKAIATATGYTDSAVAIATYTIGGGGGPGFAALCAQLFDSVLTLSASCTHTNPDVLTALLAETVDCADVERAIAAGRVVYDSAQGLACQTALGSLTCQDLLQGEVPAVCLAALSGTVANGGPCYGDIDCQAGWCSSSGSVCPGTCQAFAQLGQSCSASVCAPNLTCDSTCKAPSAAGGPCPCGAGLWCSGTTCAAQKTSGACSASEECAIGYVCTGTPTTTCQALVGLNGNCTGNPELCGLGYTCSANACVPWPSVGQACSGPCIGGYCDLFAMSPTCVAYKTAGQTCPLGFECAPSLACTAGTCAPTFCAEP